MPDIITPTEREAIAAAIQAGKVRKIPMGVTGFIARLYPYDACLIFFHGATAGQARDAATAYRDDVVAKNETAFQNRMAAVEKTKAAKARV